MEKEQLTKEASQKGTPTFRFFLIFSLMFILWIALVCRMLIQDSKFIEEFEKHNIETFKALKFTGNVLAIRQYDYGGRLYGLIYVELDYCNIDSLYVFDKYVCMSISNNIAVFPTNIISTTDTYDQRSKAILNAKYVMVNMDNKMQTVYKDAEGNKFAEDFDFRSLPFKEKQFIKALHNIPYADN